MRKLVAIIGLVFITIGCGSQPTNTATESPSTGDSNATSTTQPADATILIVDVRSKEEWDAGHLEQAIHIPHTEIADQIGEHTADKNQKIIVYCKVGGRAGMAKESLEKLGFVDVENAGGFDDVKTRFGE